MAGSGAEPGGRTNAGKNQIALPPGAAIGGHRFTTGPGAYELSLIEP